MCILILSCPAFQVLSSEQKASPQNKDGTLNTTPSAPKCNFIIKASPPDVDVDTFNYNEIISFIKKGM